MSAESGADRFDATTGPLGQLASNLRLACPGLGHLAGPIDELFALLVGQLAEPGTPLDTLGIVLDKPIDAAAEKADPLAAVEHQAAAHEPQGSPARNRLGRDVELLRQFLDREDLLADGISVELDRVGQVFDQQPQIVQQVRAGNLTVARLGKRPANNLREDIGRWVRSLSVDVSNQPLGGFNPLKHFVPGRLLLAVAIPANTGLW